jgi:hypothetical protein
MNKFLLLSAWLWAWVAGVMFLLRTLGAWAYNSDDLDQRLHRNIDLLEGRRMVFPRWHWAVILIVCATYLVAHYS